MPNLKAIRSLPGAALEYFIGEGTETMVGKLVVDREPVDVRDARMAITSRFRLIICCSIRELILERFGGGRRPRIALKMA